MSASRAQAVYLEDQGRAYHEAKRALPDQAVPWVCRARAALFQPPLQPNDAVLEWGCGFGWNLAALKCARRAGYDVASQLKPVLLEFGLEFLENPAAAPTASFDVGLCYHALEHLPDPLTVLGELRRLVKPSGYLLLAVPFERARRYRRFDPTEPNHHLFSWNVQTLGNLLHVAGWRPRQLGLRRYGYDRRAAQLAVRFHGGERSFHAIRLGLRLLFPIREIAAVADPA